jgi:hypothetical protein
MANIMKHEHVFSYQEAEKDLDLVKLSGRLETKPRYENKADHQSKGVVSKQNGSLQNTERLSKQSSIVKQSNFFHCREADMFGARGGEALGWLFH